MTAQLPEHAEKYAESPEFTTKTVPDSLTTSHDTKPGVWGKLIVIEGALDFIIEGPPEQTIRLEANAHTVIEPQQVHRVRLDRYTRFLIEFYREPN